MEISYSELRCKEVVNTQNGARMGKMIDMIIDTNGKNVLGIVVPGVKKLFKGSEDIFIPWRSIAKIGTDVILVCLEASMLTSVAHSQEMNLEGENHTDSPDYL